MEDLKPYRARIDSIDDQIVDLIAARLDVIREVGHLKAEQGIPSVLQDRIDAVLDRCADRAEDLGVDPDLIREIYSALITHSCDLEEEIIGAT